MKVIDRTQAVSQTIKLIIEDNKKTVEYINLAIKRAVENKQFSVTVQEEIPFNVSKVFEYYGFTVYHVRDKLEIRW